MNPSETRPLPIALGGPGAITVAGTGDPASFDAALAELSHRVERLAPRLAAIS